MTHKRPPIVLFCAVLTLCGTLLSQATARGLGWNADALVLEMESQHKLPPPPEGVVELKFSDFFKMPIGPRGPELTDKFKTLDGRRVRIVGFMTKQTRPSPGIAIVAPYALSTHEGEYGLCDDLPPTSVFVEVPKFRDIAVPFTPGPLVLTGRLELGPREETDGRVSHIRLFLDSEPHTTAKVVSNEAQLKTTNQP
jgi:hypothetical protein